MDILLQWVESHQQILIFAWEALQDIFYDVLVTRTFLSGVKTVERLLQLPIHR